jgi:nitroreductase
MRAGSSVATCALVRRRITGRSARARTPRSAAGVASSPCESRARALNVVDAPNIPGFRNSIRLQSSSSRFSIGVPVIASREIRRPRARDADALVREVLVAASANGGGKGGGNAPGNHTEKGSAMQSARGVNRAFGTALESAPEWLYIPLMPDTHPFIPLAFQRLSLDESLARARSFYEAADRRRTTRQFSKEPVDRRLIEYAIRTAGTAPSGAHQQPWTFVAISDGEVKRRLRDAAEAEEHENYHGRMPGEWIEALAPLGTDEHKTHLTDAPWIVVLFRQSYGVRESGEKRTHYYTQESCGIAAGLFIAAVHTMGLVTLTHTPNPMGFLGELLERPPNEKAMLVMPVGYPAADARVPDLRRKLLEEIAVWR